MYTLCYSHNLLFYFQVFSPPPPPDHFFSLVCFIFDFVEGECESESLFNCEYGVVGLN
jgi:hypothetical protein